MRGLHENHGTGNCTPNHHQQCDPAPRAHARKHQIAGQLEEKISGEKYSGAEAVDSFAQSQLLQHFQLGKANVDAIQISDDVKDKKEWDQTQRNFGNYRRSRVLFNSAWGWNEIRRGNHLSRDLTYSALSRCSYS